MIRDGTTYHGIEKDESTYFARMLLAQYIIRVADEVTTEPWFFSVRGNCWLSLNRHIGLTPTSYAKPANFVHVRKGDVRMNTKEIVDKWMKRDEYGLQGDSTLGCSEFTSSTVWLDKIHPLAQEVKKTLPLIRIGRYKEGETIDAAVAINNGVKPPPFCHRLRTHQRWFSMQIRNILSSYNKHDDLERVVEWVKMEELDDSLSVHYNLNSVTASKQQTTLSTPLVKAAATSNKDEGGDADEEEDEQNPAKMKYAAGPNYPGSHPKLINKVTPEHVTLQIQKALEKILSRGLTINAVLNEITVTEEEDAAAVQALNMMDFSDSDEDDDESFHVDPQAIGSEYNEDFAEKYPLLSRFALPLFQTRDDDPLKRAANNRSNMPRELVTLMQEQGDDIKFESLNSRYTTTLLPVGDKPAKDILASLFETDGDTVGAEETIEWVLKYLTENYKESLHAELRKLKLIPKLLDEFEIAALIDHANLDITEWRGVVQALKAFQNVKHIGASVDKWTEIGKAAGEVKYDEWIYPTKDEDGTTKHEKIKYWWKDPVAEVTSMVASILNGYADLKPDDIAFIYVCHGGDHGKAKFRFTTKLIIQFKEGGPCIERLLPVGDILCKKDSAEVLRTTLIPKLAAGVNRLANEHLIFKKDDEDKWCVTLGAADPDSIKPESFVAGDLAYLACLLGKDGFEGDWCNWCKSYNTTWHDPNCRCDPWTIDGLKDQATANKTESLKGTRRMGVKNLPPFFDIPVENIIFISSGGS